jgi:hypothetical protein
MIVNLTKKRQLADFTVREIYERYGQESGTHGSQAMNEFEIEGAEVQSCTSRLRWCVFSKKGAGPESCSLAPRTGPFLRSCWMELFGS